MDTAICNHPILIRFENHQPGRADNQFDDERGSASGQLGRFWGGV